MFKHGWVEAGATVVEGFVDKALGGAWVAPRAVRLLGG